MARSLMTRSRPVAHILLASLTAEPGTALLDLDHAELWREPIIGILLWWRAWRRRRASPHTFYCGLERSACSTHHNLMIMRFGPSAALTGCAPSRCRWHGKKACAKRSPICGAGAFARWRFSERLPCSGILGRRLRSALSLIHISEPPRPYSISYAAFCL